MPPFGSDNALPECFDGSVKLFPLPNLVIFPGVIQALHLFEPRYRKMFEDALKTDNLITLALPDPSSESDLQLSPPLCPTVCIGKIITHHRLEDGRYNFLLMGIQRARIIEEIGSDEPYRIAKVEVMQDNCAATDEQIGEARLKLVKLFRKQAGTAIVEDEELVANLTNPELPFGMLVDLICFSTGADSQFMYQMLTTQDAWTRHLLLLKLIESQKTEDAESRPFPPDFSNN
ncbi:LON peptidase substrate-binding domain-containing protein [bacterium]|nr:LON peptidase substrate-binding domain-containing protein [bacterium]